MTTTPASRELDDADLDLLQLAAAPHYLPGRRERAMGELGLTPTSFWQRVNDLLDDRQGLEHDPHLVHRLRRIRDRRSQRRLPAPAR